MLFCRLCLGHKGNGSSTNAKESGKKNFINFKMNSVMLVLRVELLAIYMLQNLKCSPLQEIRFAFSVPLE